MYKFNGDFSTVWLINENRDLAVSYNPCVLNARKLAAIDLVFLGPKVIIAEFVAGVFLSAALGIFVLVRSHGSPAQIALGLYLITLGLNYVPMLIYAVVITKGNSASAQLGSELENKRVAMANYRRQSLWLLVPLVLPLVALTEGRAAVERRNAIPPRGPSRP